MTDIDPPIRPDLLEKALEWALRIPGLEVFFLTRTPTRMREYISMSVPLYMEHAFGYISFMPKPYRETNGKWYLQNESEIYFLDSLEEEDVYGYAGYEMGLLIVDNPSMFTNFQLKYMETRVRIPSYLDLDVPLDCRDMIPGIIYD